MVYRYLLSSVQHPLEDPGVDCFFIDGLIPSPKDEPGEPLLEATKEKTTAWQFSLTFLGWSSDPFKG